MITIFKQFYKYINNWYITFLYRFRVALNDNDDYYDSVDYL
jgi:hypothetical protein